MKNFRMLFACFTVFVLSSAPSYGAEMKMFPIGALFPMTGPQAYYGRVMSRGALIGIDHINAAGGVEGYKFKLVITDFKNVDVGLALTGVQKMSVIDRIPCVLSSFSTITLGIQPVCATGRILMINGGAYSPKLSNKPYLYSTKLSQNQMVPPMLKYFWEMNVRRLGIIHIADPAGAIPAETLVRPIWTKMGGLIVATEPHLPGLTDYTPYLTRIMAGKPDAIYDISTGQDQAFIIRQAREMGMDIPVTVPDWNTDWNAIAGKTSENVYIPGDYFNRESSDPSARRFVEDYEAKWKESPDLFAANYYDAVYNIFPELIKRVLKDGGNPLSGADLEKAIWTDPSFQTIYGGKMRFNRDGSSNKPMVIFKITDGKKTVHKQVAVE
ncbi:MAG TPA: amino acid ABC transporter substrate-binding protein [Desulfobacterales bacterium]|nr:amino acid ABC transporter substrate-binding protein [Desulfobacterales bacterium]